MGTSGGSYPPIAPYDAGMLDVGDGNAVYWETCGNPDGIPALVLHGGPGSGCVPGMRQTFDPDRFRIVLFDQRGCGRSTPHASDPTVDLITNTTDHLIADIELLRRHLDIERWLLVGWSWGTTLGLAYAQQYPDRIAALVLALVVTTSRSEVEWITRDVGRLFPADWAKFRDGVPAAERAGSLVDAYSRLLNDPDPTIRAKAARDWCDWEESHVQIGPERRPNPRFEDPRFRMCFARLVTHYWRHGAWRADGELLRNIGTLAAIPAVLVHGRLDLSSPPDIAWRLAQAWPTAELHIVHDIGHSAGPAISEHVITAVDRHGRLQRRDCATTDIDAVE